MNYFFSNNELLLNKIKPFPRSDYYKKIEKIYIIYRFRSATTTGFDRYI